MEINNEEFRKFATRTKRPIAGQSLTDDPENPWPWERPPRFTTKAEGIDFFASLFTDEEVFPTLMKLIEEDVAIMDIVQMYLTDAFQKGLVNPDLMMLLAEPLAFMLMGLAEQEEIEYTIMDDEDELEETPEAGNVLRSNLRKIGTPQNDQEIDLTEKIQGAPSLMARTTGG
jgi:hypothetical protein